MKVIIYGSKYGSSEQYAKSLSEKTNAPILTYKEVKDINAYSTIVYIGALYAGGVCGLMKTFKGIKDVDDKKIIIVTVGISDPHSKKKYNLHQGKCRKTIA